MNRASQIIRTSVIGIIANVMLAAFKATVGVYAVSTGSHRRTELQDKVIKTLSDVRTYYSYTASTISSKTTGCPSTWYQTSA